MLAIMIGAIVTSATLRYHPGPDPDKTPFVARRIDGGFHLPVVPIVLVLAQSLPCTTA